MRILLLHSQNINWINHIMSSTTVIALITALIICSFALSAISYTRQQALKKRNQKVKLLQQQADEALYYISLLLRIDKKYDLILQLQNMAMKALSSALSLHPACKVTQSALTTQGAKLKEYQDNKRGTETTNWLKSTAELNSTQSELGQVSKLLDVYRNKGDLKLPRYQELQNHLNNLRQDLYLNTYLFQADTCGEQNNITSYQLFIKQAIQVVKRTSMDDAQKTQKIKELSARIQEVKRTGKTSELPKLITPSE